MFSVTYGQHPQLAGWFNWWLVYRCGAFFSAHAHRRDAENLARWHNEAAAGRDIYAGATACSV